MSRVEIPAQKGNNENNKLVRMHESAHVQGGHC